MVAKFRYERASMAIAEADIFGDKHSLEKYGINQSTLWRWRERSAEDPKLHEMALLKKRMLLVDWQRDATENLKIGIQELKKRYPLCQTEEDAKAMDAIARSLKIVGELKLAYEALSEPESSNVSSDHYESQSA